jgi:lipoate-protein ligase A
MAVLDSIVCEGLEPATLLGLQLYLLEAVAARRSAPALLIYTLGGRLISIGRYHRYHGTGERNGIGGYRRLTGGRIVGAGEGWLGCALILTSRSELLRAQDAAIKPEQVMNRYARGILAGLRTVGVESFYPGRDAITIDRREVAMCSFETDASGAMLFEALVALNRGLEDTVYDIERFDPEGALGFPLYDRGRATKLVRELGRDLAVQELAGVIEAGYASTLSDVSRRALSGEERAQAEDRGRRLLESGWLGRACESPSLKAGRAPSQLGYIEARVALDDAGHIEQLELSGDFIANSTGVAAFEREARGKSADFGSMSAAAMKVFGDGSNFILGIGDLSNLANLIAKAQ